MLSFDGSLAALVTPFTRQGSIDWAAWQRLLQWHLAAHTDGLVVGGTTGESPTLTDAELVRLVERAKTLSGACPVIAGSGTNSTATTIEKTQRLAAAGADAALVVCPYYSKPTQAGLIAHFTAIADVSPIPLILYNVPGRTAVDLLPDTVQALSGHPNIQALKEASGSLERISELVRLVAGRLVVLTGDDHLTVEAIARGARGVISVTANVAPALLHEMCELALAGHLSAARRQDAKLQALHAALFVESNPLPTKFLLAHMGLIENELRLPLVPLSVTAQPHVLEAFAALPAPDFAPLSG